jgi:predicted methyltransferase
LALTATAGAAYPTSAQEKSVNPGINDPFKKPDIKAFIERFETESREIYQFRNRIVEACRPKPGDRVADIGAGTGLFTRLFARKVGPAGKVYAVEIAVEFLDHINKTAAEQSLKNIETVLCTQESVALPPESVDVAFVCDTYHHFEFPQKTLASLMRALRPAGRLIVIDFHRKPGVSTDWVLKHVRADQDVFVREIRDAGFERLECDVDVSFLKQNYFVQFRRPPIPARVRLDRRPSWELQLAAQVRPR